MFFQRLFITSIFAVVLFASLYSNASNHAAESFTKFSEYTEGSKLEMDFSIVDQLLHAGVLNMGPSKRTLAAKTSPSLGTNLRQHVDRPTENEANRFFYENLKADQEKILKLRKELEAIASIRPLKEYSREALLAYWLNLYTVTLVNELAVIYPLNDLKPVLTGVDSMLDKKLLLVDGTSLSLNDIHYRIVPLLYPDDPIYIYGFHQGIKGSPNIRSKAYTAQNVKKSLLENAREFVNSNRGTQFNGGAGVVRISSFYERNASLFQDFENGIKPHLLKYSNGSFDESIASASTFKANINNWRITDLYGSIRRRDHGVHVSSRNGNRLASGEKLSAEQRAQLVSIMRVRAVNFGGGRVYVTDLPSTPTEDESKETQE